MKELYLKNQKLIRKLAWKNAPKLGMSFEEMESELNEVFCSVAPEFNSEKGAFSTFFTTVCYHHISSLIIRQSRLKRSQEDLSEFFVEPLSESPDQEAHLIMKEKVESNSILKNIVELLQVYQPPQTGGIKAWITKQLRKQGIPWQEIWEGYRSIGEMR
jgi:hypothetical protein